MKRLLTTIIYISFLIAVFTSCKKENDDPKIVKLYPEGLKYIQMTPGKYLIYKDSASGALDSVVVTKSLLEKIFVPAHTGTNFWGITSNIPAYYYESFTMILTKFSGFSSMEWLNAATYTFILDYPPNMLDIVFDSQGNGGRIFSYPTPDIIPSLTIEQKNYIDVIKYEQPVQIDINNPDYKKVIYYWAKGVGLIKRVTITTGGSAQTHTLLRNN